MYVAHLERLRHHTINLQSLQAQCYNPKMGFRKVQLSTHHILEPWPTRPTSGADAVQALTPPAARA